MKKIITFIKDLESPDHRVTWPEGTAYKVTFENDGLYLLEEKDGIVCGLDKADEGEIYRVGVTDDEA